VEATLERRGFVYGLLRPDLNTCYIGQSVHNGRPWHHMREGTYQRAVLCADGIHPIVEHLEIDVPEGTKLDDAERDWMRAMVEEGWILINVLGPDDVFPHIPRDSCAKGGKNGGSKGGTRTAQHRAEDPEFDKLWREVAARAGGLAWAEKRRTDPEFDAYMRIHEAIGRVNSAEVRRLKRLTDPEFVKNERESGRRGGFVGGPAGGRKTASLRRLCAECGYGPTTPGGLGQHQKSRNHAGFLAISPEPPGVQIERSI
jgi:hypothetical protein